MADIRCDVERVGTRLLVRVAGELSLSSAPRLRATMLKCLVEQPDAVVVDLAETTVSAPAALSVFTAVSRQAALWPGTPLMIAVPDPEIAGSLGIGHSRLAIFPSLSQALATAPRRVVAAIGDMLLPVSGAARHARDLATEACIRWDLPALTGAASLIAGELVSNAVAHAGTMADLRLTLGRRHLMIAVRDGSSAEPRLHRGAIDDPAASRGLLLVDAMAYRWGSLATADGKVVWATLSRRAPLT